jgi:hypothetical protein
MGRRSPSLGEWVVLVAPADGSKQTDQLREILVESARTQLAAVAAAIKFWAGWVESADRYTHAIADELAKMEREEGESGDLVARLSDLTREYVRNMTTLPAVAVQHFSEQLEQIGKPKPRRSRAAKVKE